MQLTGFAGDAVFQGGHSLFYLTVFIVAAIASFIGSVTDIQKREIADWVTMSLIVFGIGSAALYSGIFWVFEPVVFSVLGLAGFFLVGWVMFRMGWWGGGDSKLLMGLGACFGIPFSLSFPFVDAGGFMMSFLSNFLISSALYTLLWMVLMILLKQREFSRVFARKMRKVKKILLAGSLVGAVLFSLSFFFPDPIARVFFLTIGMSLVFLFSVIPAARSVQVLMLRRVSPYELTEGELIAEDVAVEGRVVAGSKDLGASKAQIKELQKLYDEKKINRVLIKIGIPLIPNFFVTMIMTFLFGNVLMLAVEKAFEIA